MTKYHARSIEIDGYRFDSLAEGRRYNELRLLVNFGEISDLKVHPRFIIWQHHGGASKRADIIEYEGDFSYLDHGKQTVEDVKGVLTPVYRLKKKMFLAKYPDIKFVELKGS